MKKIILVTATLLALGSVASVVVPSFAQDTTASNGEAVSQPGNQGGASKSEGGGGNATNCSDLSALSSSVADASSAAAVDCASSSAAQ